MKHRLAAGILILSVLLLACTWTIETREPTVPPVSGQSMRVVMFDIGQGDSILVVSPNRQTMLIDGGNSAKDGREVILPYLKANGFDRLNVMVLTHPDADHVGGLPEVLRGIPVDRVVSTGQVHTTQIYAEFLQELGTARDERGTQVIRGVAGVEIPFDAAVKVEVLGPDRAAIDGSDLNNASVVLRLTYGEVSVLFTGDAEQAEEAWMIAGKKDPSAQILKVSHHGSQTGSSDAFLKAVGAQVGLISCGANNNYGHPHAEVLERLARHGVEVYRTDKLGTIEVEIDASGWKIISER
ncbi:MAG: MBL fold metallo-hydrolase [Anaerolineae bacterium]|nr:MBL fold metallo-hydrolase [Anaerolineae bacterium]